MRVLNVLGLLLLATRPTRSVTIETGHGWGEPFGSDQANAATRISSSTFWNTMSPSQKWATLPDETKDLLFPVFELPTWEPDWLKGNSLLEFECSNINRVGPFGEISSMKEWGSSASSKIDASHISINSQQLSQEGENLDCLIDPNRLPIESEILSSKDSPENFVPANRSAQQFGCSSKNLANENPSSSSNRDESRISFDGQQSIESVKGKTFRIENTIISKNPTVDVHENFVPDGLPQPTRTMVKFRKFKYMVELREFCPLLNWDLDEVKDFKSLCVFLGKKMDPEQVEFHNRVTMTKHMMKLLLRGKSGRDTLKVQQTNIVVPHPRLIGKATTTIQKLIIISNVVLKLVSCTRSLIDSNNQVKDCLKHAFIPILRCLVNCCGKNIVMFQERWGQCFKHYRFGDKRCPGRGSDLNICGFQRTKIVKHPKHKDSGFLDLDELIKAVSTSKRTEEKLELFWKFNEIYLSSDPMAQTCHEAYYSRSAKPIWECFVHHCGQNINEWIRKWGPELMHSQFSERRCQGLKSHRCGEYDPPFDVKARQYLRFESTRDLLPVLSDIFQQYNQFMIAKTESMRPPHPDLTTLVRECLRPVNNCLSRHCDGSVEEFVRRWGERFTYSKFRLKCCPGSNTKDVAICHYIPPPSQG